MKKVMSLTVYRNGAIAAFDEFGEQIRELQTLNIYDLLGKRATDLGYDVLNAQVDASLIRKGVLSYNVTYGWYISDLSREGT